MSSLRRRSIAFASFVSARARRRSAAARSPARAAATAAESSARAASTSASTDGAVLREAFFKPGPVRSEATAHLFANGIEESAGGAQDTVSQRIDLRVGDVVGGHGESGGESGETAGDYLLRRGLGAVEDLIAQVPAHSGDSGGIRGEIEGGTHVGVAGSGEELDPGTVGFEKPVGQGAFGDELLDLDADRGKKGARGGATEGGLGVNTAFENEAEFSVATLDPGGSEQSEVVDDVGEGDVDGGVDSGHSDDALGPGDPAG
jgi:hypothetical protein